MTSFKDTRDDVAAILLVLIIGILGLSLPRSCSQQDQAAAQQRRLDQVTRERDSAVVRATRIMDSALRADETRDSAWLSYVRAFRDSGEQAMQRSSRAAAARARRDVARRGGDLLEAPDTGSGRPPCLVTLTCSEAAAWQASDSLMRAAAESTTTWVPVAAAACSARVAQARVACESACTDLARSAAGGQSFLDTLLVIVGVGLVSFLSGWMAGL